MRFDPDDLAARAALARAFAVQRAGLGIALAGAILAGLKATWLPALPRIIPLALIALALGLIGIGIVRRLRLYRRPR